MAHPHPHPLPNELLAEMASFVRDRDITANPAIMTDAGAFSRQLNHVVERRVLPAARVVRFYIKV